MSERKIVYLPIDDVVENPDNPRKITREKMDKLIESLRACPELFDARPCICSDRTGRNIILGGNMRYQAARALAYEKVPVVIMRGLTEAQEREIAIKDNGDFGEWDYDLLGAWGDLPFEDWGIDFPTVQPKKKEAQDAEPKIDQARELNKKWQVCPGDLWLVGEHRLLCGDSTRADDVERVLGGSAFMMVTDPPYGVKYDASWRECFGESHNLSRGKVLNDERARWSSAYTHAKVDVAYVWHASNYSAQVALGLEACKYEIRAQIIWKKTNIVISRGDYHWGHEACWYAVKKGKTSRWVGGRKQKTVWADIMDTIKDQEGLYAVLIDPLTVYAFPAEATTVWELSKDKQCGGGHSTQKPLECMARPIRNHGAAGDKIYDPFLGSGTTMVACENLERKCRGIELNPNYCAVILERMENAFPGLEIRRA